MTDQLPLQLPLIDHVQTDPQLPASPRMMAIVNEALQIEYREAREAREAGPGYHHDEAESFVATTERAIAKAKRGMDADWAARAQSVISGICRTQQTFTADDVWEHIEHPREPSALGVVLRRAAKQGDCICTDQYAQSTRPATHRRPLRVWRSLVI